MIKKYAILLIISFFSFNILGQQVKLGLPYKHTADIIETIFSPKGNLIATVSEKEAIIWNPYSGKIINYFSGPFEKGSFFSPDGAVFVGNKYFTGNKVPFYDVKTGELLFLQSIKMFDNIQSFCYDYDVEGDNLVIIDKTSHVKIINYKTGEILKVLPDESIVYVKFRKVDGLLITVDKTMTLKVWNYRNSKVINTYEKFIYPYDIIENFISPNGEFFVNNKITNTSNFIKVFDVLTGSQIKKLDLLIQSDDYYDFTDERYSLIGFKTNNNEIFLDLDGVLGIWEFGNNDKNDQHKIKYAWGFGVEDRFIILPDGVSGLSYGDESVNYVNWTDKEISYKCFKGYDNRCLNSKCTPIVSKYGDKLLTTLSLLKDSLLIESVGVIKTNLFKKVVVWNIKTMKQLFSLNCSNEEISRAYFSPDGKFIVTVSSKTVNIWDSEKGYHISELTTNGKRVKKVGISSDRKYVVTSSSDDDAKYWNLISGKLVSKLNNFEGQVEDLSFSLNTKNVFTTTKLPENGVYSTIMWNSKTGQKTVVLDSFPYISFKPFYSPKNNYFGVFYNNSLFSYGGYRFRLYNANSGKLLNVINSDFNQIYTLVFSPDEKTLLFLEDESVYRFDIERDILDTIGYADYQYIQLPNFTNDSKKYIVNSGVICNSSTGEVFLDLNSKNVYFKTAIFNNDSDRILGISGDGKATQWISPTGEIINEVNSPSDKFTNAIYSPDGNLFTTLSEDNYLKIWNSISSELVFVLKNDKQRVNDFEYSPDGRLMIATLFDSLDYSHYKINIYSTEEGTLLDQFKEIINYEVPKLFFRDNSNVLNINSIDGEIRLWTQNNGVHDFRFYEFGNDPNNLFTLCKDGYYKGTKDAVQSLYYTIGTSVYPPEQFDLKYNRPDIILDRLGYADYTLIKAYYKAYLKRLKNMNFTEEMLKNDFHIPEIKVKNFEEMPAITDSSYVGLNLNLNDSKYKLDRINIWVNDVAVYGIDGISLRDKDVQKYNTTIDVKLTKGKNKVQVSVLNQAGAESYKETLNIESTAGKDRPDLYINVISVSEYQQKEMNLKYAVKDGRDIANMFANVDRNQWANVYVDTLFNTNATIENVKALKEKLNHTDVNDQVILYVSGHGLLDDNLDFYFASHDVDFTDPKLRGISYESLEDLLDGIPARKKLFMMDACHSGEVDKDELISVNTTNNTSGLKSGIKSYSYRGSTATKTNKAKGSKLGLQNSFELMQELFTNLNRGSGAIVISAAAGDSYALESSEWNNGVFTYAVLNGLKNKEADANTDGEVTVSELRTYVIEQVKELTNGNQKPTSRQENVEFDFRVW